jgi:hypothetical protein
MQLDAVHFDLPDTQATTLLQIMAEAQARAVYAMQEGGYTITTRLIQIPDKL